mgnify:CR=1 FL=1
MTNEELEKEVKRLEEQITELRFKILESKSPPIPYKPYEVEVPKDVEDYVYINNVGNIYNLNTLIISEIEKIYERGLAFKTREEAEQFDKERRLLFKMRKWAEEHNGGWTPDWNKMDKAKYCVEYNNYTEEFIVDYYSGIFTFTKLPYFKSREIAEQFIEEFGDEIKEVFC